MAKNMERLKLYNPERFKPHDATQRVKVAVPGITVPTIAVQSVNEAWEVAVQKGYLTPLVQARAILPISVEEDLLREAALMENGTVVNGRIPFRDPGSKKDLAIYYLQIEDSRRRRYPFQDTRKDITHREAVERARKEGLKSYENDHNYQLVGLAPGGELFGNGRSYNIKILAEKLVQSHKACFVYPHDPKQQTIEGMIDILENNPNVIAFTQTGEVAAVGVMELDSSFSGLPDINIYEPTFWTVPDHRRQGLSVGLRQEMMRLSNSIGSTIFFSESIRATSFQTSQRAGCRLAGNADLSISGDLGKAYTAIGPANPDTGFMPMGLTYYTSKDISIH
jgi:hypothetical protein